MRDWINICETAYFNGYEKEMFETIKENIEEFRQFAFQAVKPFMMYDKTNGVNIFYYFKNNMDIGFNYFLGETLLDTDPWFRDQWRRYVKLMYGDEEPVDYERMYREPDYPDEYYYGPDYSDYIEDEEMFVDTYCPYCNFYY